MNLDQRLEEKNDPENLKKRALSAENTFYGFFIKNYRFSILIILALVIFGIMALFQLPREAEPEVEIPIGIVTTIYSGASPTDIESLITNKLEDEFKTLENIKEITSVSATGYSSVVVEFVAEADLETSIRKLREAADKARAKLPSDAEDPNVSEIRFSDIAIITFSLQGNFSQTELNNYAKILQEKLESIPLVSRVSTIGYLKKQFNVLIDKEKLNGLNLSISSVIQSLSANNLNLPVGSLEIDNLAYQLRLEGQIENAQELSNLAVGKTPEGQIIYLKDLAEVKDSFEEQLNISRLSLNGQPSLPTVSLQVYKKTGGNILNIITDSKSAIADLQQKGTLPADLNILITNDNSKYVADDLKRLGSNALGTIAIIFIILMFVLGWREAFIAGISIPLSFLSAFLFIKIQGETLNSFVLFSLVLALGLLVDTIIVIMEGIYDNINRKKMNRYEGTLLAVKEFFWPVTSGTMTTVAAFLPLLLVSGIMGQYMGILPKTISAVLISALFISVTLIPAIASKTLKPHKIKAVADNDESETEKKGNAFTRLRHKVRNKFHKGISILKNWHVETLNKVLPNKKIRRKYLLITWLLFFVLCSFPIIGLLKIEMFPAVDVDYFIINIETPKGSSLAVTEQTVTQVEDLLSQNNNIKNFLVTIGSSVAVGGFDFGGQTGGSENTASITVNLKDEAEREFNSFEIAGNIRNQVKKITGADIKIQEIAAGPPTGSPVEVRITGNDIEVLNQLADQMINYLSEIEGAINIEKNLESATGEFVIYPKQDVLTRYGLSNLSLATALRQKIHGADASEITLDNEDIKINVQLKDKQIENINDVKNLIITTPTNEQVVLSTVADIEFESSLIRIEHRDGDRLAVVSAEVENTVPQQVFTELQKKTADLNLPSGYTIEYGGENEEIEQSYSEIFLSFLLALVLIAAILILQFNSFKQPLIILSTLPLALIGVFFGLTILRLSFSLPAFIGIVGLAGIVVNDAIILIDKINQNIYQHRLPVKEAIIEASQSRMQPIFLTTLTTVVGILPLGLSDPIWAGLSFSIIFGLTFATFLTLIIVPIMFMIMERKRAEKFLLGEIERN